MFVEILSVGNVTISKSQIPIVKSIKSYIEMKSLDTYFESLLDDDDIFLDSGNEKKLVE